MFTLINFASLHREIQVAVAANVRLDAVLHLTMSVDVTVTGKATFANLANVENPCPVRHA
jgi:hypothetical protein